MRAGIGFDHAAHSSSCLPARHATRSYAVRGGAHEQPESVHGGEEGSEDALSARSLEVYLEGATEGCEPGEDGRLRRRGGAEL